MKREPVESSNLKSVGYDPCTRVLEIEFKDGSVYEYDDVPCEVHSGLMDAESKGSFFYENIRKRDYEYRRIC